METLILENVRCFHGRHELPLAPLTVLVGENSTGKSTLLAAIRLAWDVGCSTLDVDFNEEPFDWGAYDQIAHFRGGRGGRAKSFLLGFELSLARSARAGMEGSPADRVRVEAAFAQKGAQPRILEWSIRSATHKVVTKSEDSRAQSILQAGDRQYSFEFDVVRAPWPTFPREMLSAIEKIVSVPREMPDDVQGVQTLLAVTRKRLGQRPYAIAPIRTKPLRTYEPRRETHRPEGEHVPMILAAMKSAGHKDWGELRDQLRRFGADSGLFKNLDIKRLGTKESDPFQLQINIAGLPTSLLDVGYGVSQVLPIAVDCLTCSPGQMLLVQQPEVHVHPRAQAELATLMGYAVKTRKNRLVVETHSDYLIDRIRLDVRDGKYLKPEDVSILYCERHGLEVKVFPLRIDPDGNLVDAPAGYRRFFLEEEKRLMEG